MKWCAPFYGDEEDNRWMDGWRMDGWMEDGWMDGGWMDGWMDGWTVLSTCIELCTYVHSVPQRVGVRREHPVHEHKGARGQRLPQPEIALPVGRIH